MLINPSYYNFIEKIIFDLQITIDRVHPVQIFTCSDYYITTNKMQKTPKNKGLVPTILYYTKFSWTCGFR